MEFTWDSEKAKKAIYFLWYMFTKSLNKS